jgi:hypothetical protein
VFGKEERESICKHPQHLARPSPVSKAAIAWLILTQIMASAMGGYLAGRLRTKWTDLHTDEVYFRDTAHGFLVWAVGLVITASLLATAATSLAGGAAQRSASEITVGGAASEGMVNPNAYFVDSLLRSGNAPKTETTWQCVAKQNVFSRMHYPMEPFPRPTVRIWRS